MSWAFAASCSALMCSTLHPHARARARAAWCGLGVFHVDVYFLVVHVVFVLPGIVVCSKTRKTQAFVVFLIQSSCVDRSARYCWLFVSKVQGVANSSRCEIGTVKCTPSLCALRVCARFECEVTLSV